jgi:death-on-curing protein
MRNHPFVDGKKRTGITAAALFLRRNGYRLSASHAEVEAFTLAVARSEPDQAALAAWLEAHCVKGE